MITTLAEAELYLDSLPRSKKASYDERGNRARLLYGLVGNPQESFPSIHIAGTSGKGSVATIAATLLQAAGIQVGLSLSPHVTDIRERFQVNGELITEAELCEHLHTLIPHLNTVALSEYGPASYFEVVTAIAFLAFRAHMVDYAVIEVGIGGMRDATNTIERTDKLAVIGQIGLDHTEFLGDTPAAIAKEKAGIIPTHGHAIALSQTLEVNTAFEQQAASKLAVLELFVSGKHVQHIHPSASGTVFNLKLKPWIWRDLKLGLIGRHQAINAGLALRAVQYVCQRDRLTLDESTVRGALLSLRFPGRFDVKHLGNKTIILDGAHNQQKFRSLRSTLKTIYPHQKFDFIIGHKSKSEHVESAELFKPLAYNIIPIKVTLSGANDAAAIALALESFLTSKHAMLVVTGSFYLVGSMYNELKKRGIA